ncbi:MAG: TIGR03936 family radical SAM-associated protein [Oscillospiraceae bacterium]|nr:TIGR03936 family radical SAM-associated protein [Oscillospiraceae bacterium]
MVNKLRLRYSKTGKAKYISHLDLMATMRRALTRAGVALKYSEGFNPHPYISVAMPLSVGLESDCELMDIGLATDSKVVDLPERLSGLLPEGLVITESYTPLRKFSDISWLEITGVLYYDKAMPDDLAQKLMQRYSCQNILISKKTKRGMSDIDISPHIRDVEFHGGEKITFRAKISAQNPTLGPDNIMAALDDEYERLAPDYAAFSRYELFDESISVFR